MAEDKILFKYEVDTTALDIKLKKVESELLGVETASKKTSNSIQDGAKKSAKELDKVDKNVKGLGDSMSTLANNLPFAGQVQQLLQMGGALKGMTGATGGATSAMKILKVALASTGIGLLVIGIAGLIAYFKKTDDGARKLEGAFDAVEIIMSKIVDVFIEIGGKAMDVFSSFENLQQGLKDLGSAILTNVINRFKSVAVLIEAVGLATDGKYKEAMIKASDAMIQLGTGVTDASKKFEEMGKAIDKAVQDGQKLAQMRDDLEEKEREYGVAISESEIRLSQLLIKVKNVNISGEERIKLLKEAAKIEEGNFNKTLEIEEDKLAIIKEEIRLKQQRAIVDGKAVGLLDEEANKIAAQEIVINKLKEQSGQLQEKIQNRLTQAQELNFKQQIDSLNENLKEKLLIEEQSYLDGNITKEVYEKRSIDLTIDSLEQQANFTKIFGQNDIDIQKAILDLKLKQKEEANKKLLDTDKAYYDVQNQNITDESEITKQLLISTQLDQIEAGKLTQKEASIQLLEFDKSVIQRRQDLAITASQDTLKLEEDQLKKENEIKKALYDADVENKKKADEEKKQIIIASLNLIAEVASEIASRGFDARKEQIDSELRLTQEKADKETVINQAQLDKGIISQAQFDARQTRLDKKKRDAEATAKRKQFEADKEAAIVQATISSLLAFVVSLASAPLPGSLIPAGIALATGLVQVALIASKPTPKFAKGGIIDGKSHTQGGVHIEAEGGEYIINKNQTSKNKGVLDAINKGTFDKYVHNNYILPSLKSNIINARENSSNVNNKLLESLVMNGMIDTSNLERITKRNKTVSIDNGKEIASTIASKINSKSYVK